MEAGGKSLAEGDHAARFEGGKLGVLQGCKTWILQNNDGQINQTHSVSAGLDYAAIGPEHAYYRDLGRIDYANARTLMQCMRLRPSHVKKEFSRLWKPLMDLPML